MSTYFQDNLLRFLPAEFLVQDHGFGDLVEYLQIIAIPLDEFDTLIEDFTSIFDVETCDPKYLPYLAKMLNYELDDRDDVNSKRTQLRNAVAWYKRKGMEESFRILFYSLGYSINLVELWTRDYKTFFRYPGTFTPPIFPAKVVGTSLVFLTIGPNNRNLAVKIDGGSELTITLPLGDNLTLASIADYLNVSLLAIGGECYLDSSDHIVIASLKAGADSIVSILEVESDASSTLGLQHGRVYGIDYNVPDSWPELFENGGSWYKSPHFGIEAFSIKNYVIDEEEFRYIRSRIELVRPAHTVLGYLDYAKNLSDVFGVTESDLIGDLLPGVIEQWPFPVCIDRGRVGEYEYIRDGLVPDRSISTNTSYKHIRNSRNTCVSRSGFTYNRVPLGRGYISGPPQMPLRNRQNPYRGGYTSDEPTRVSCGMDLEELSMSLTFDTQFEWCTVVTRGGGLYTRDTEYLRDGEFTLHTWRGQALTLRNNSEDDEFNRDLCKVPLDYDLRILYYRSDYPGVYFPSLAALSNPANFGIPEGPGPGDTVLGD